jgi:hypothetical protein
MSTVCFVHRRRSPKWRRVARGSEIEIKSEPYARPHEDDDSGQRRAIGR